MEIRAISNSPQFQGKVDKSVIKFVNKCVKEACEAEVSSASYAMEFINKDTIREIQKNGQRLLKGFEDFMAKTHKKSILSLEKDMFDNREIYLRISNSQIMSDYKFIATKKIALNSTPKGMLSQLSDALFQWRQNGQSYYDANILNSYFYKLKEVIAKPGKFNRIFKKTQKLMKEINTSKENVDYLNNILEEFNKNKELTRRVNNFEKENQRILKKLFAGKDVD